MSSVDHKTVIEVTEEQAVLLVEMCEKSAVQGKGARALADLYDAATAAVADFTAGAGK